MGSTGVKITFARRTYMRRRFRNPSTMTAGMASMTSGPSIQTRMSARSRPLGEQ